MNKVNIFSGPILLARMKPNAVSVYFNKIAKHKGIDFHLHLARSFAIQEFFRLGMRKESIMKLSGHSHKSNVAVSWNS